MPNTDLIDLRRKCTELRRGYKGLQVTKNAAEEELIALRKECMELRKDKESLQITNSAVWI